MINPQTEPKSDFASRIGRSVWFDLPVTNLADAMSFYEGLLGWKYQQMEESRLADYVMIDVGGELIGGLRKIGKPLPLKKGGREGFRTGQIPLNPPFTKGEESNAPILYFTVDKLAPKVARAKELGADFVGATVDLGRDRGCYQWIRDRSGNLIGLWGPE